MANDDVRKRFCERLAAPPPPPLEATRKFLLAYCLDSDGMSEVEESIAAMAKLNPNTLIEGLVGIEGTILDPPAERGTLRRLVAWDAGWALADDTDEGALSWLKKLALVLRRHLGSIAPAPPGGLYAPDELEGGRHGDR